MQLIVAVVHAENPKEHLKRGNKKTYKPIIQNGRQCHCFGLIDIVNAVMLRQILKAKAASLHR